MSIKEEEPDDETVDFDLSKSRSRINSKSKGMTPQIASTDYRNKKILDTTGGGGKNSNIKSYT